MYIYSVTITLDKEIEAAWLDFMQHKHIADVLETKCFRTCSMRKLIDEDEKHVTYNMQYLSNSREEYFYYQRVFAEALRDEVNNLFGGKFIAQRAFFKIISEHSE